MASPFTKPPSACPAPLGTSALGGRPAAVRTHSSTQCWGLPSAMSAPLSTSQVRPEAAGGMRCVQFASARLAEARQRTHLSRCNTYAPTLAPCRRPIMWRQLLQRWRCGAAHSHQLLFGVPGGLLGRNARPRRLPALVRPVISRPRWKSAEVPLACRVAAGACACNCS